MKRIMHPNIHKLKKRDTSENISASHYLQIENSGCKMPNKPHSRIPFKRYLPFSNPIFSGVFTPKSNKPK
jgi:hypothetical protein